MYTANHGTSVQHTRLHGLPGVMSGIAATIAASVARKIETDDNHVIYGDRYTVDWY